MFSSLKRTSTSLGRATFLLLILASIIAFKCGWFVHSANAVELPHEEFKKVYQAAKAKALSKPVNNAPWFAGEYYTEMDVEGEGSGHTHNSTHYLTAGYEYFLENVCCMDCGPQSLGRVREIGDGRLELCPSYARVNWYHRECWTVSIIRWGERQYLVHSTRRFEEDVASGKEPRFGPEGGSPMRKGDWDKPADGKPQLPKLDH